MRKVLLHMFKYILFHTCFSSIFFKMYFCSNRVPFYRVSFLLFCSKTHLFVSTLPPPTHANTNTHAHNRERTHTHCHRRYYNTKKTGPRKQDITNALVSLIRRIICKTFITSRATKCDVLFSDRFLHFGICCLQSYIQV